MIKVEKIIDLLEKITLVRIHLLNSNFHAKINVKQESSKLPEYTKEKNLFTILDTIKPVNSPALSGAKAGLYKMRKTEADFIPGELTTAIINAVYLTDKIKTGSIVRRTAAEESLLTGIASGGSP